MDLNMVKDALRHQNISTSLIYARLAEDAARPAMEEHGKRIMEAAGKAGPPSRNSWRRMGVTVTGIDARFKSEFRHT